MQLGDNRLRGPLPAAWANSSVRCRPDARCACWLPYPPVAPTPLKLKLRELPSVCVTLLCIPVALLPPLSKTVQADVLSSHLFSSFC